jgi:hypothetical protein
MTNPGTDWIVGFGAAKAGTSLRDIGQNTAHLINKNNGNTQTIKDSNSALSSWSTETLTLDASESGRWITASLELVPAS